MSKAPEKQNEPTVAVAALRPHLSALVDGELEPLEAIAVQGHIRHAPALAAEVQEIERLKLAVHLAGTRDKAPDALRTRLEAQARAHFAARAEGARWLRWLVPVGGLAAAAAALALTVGSGAGPAPDAATPSVASAHHASAAMAPVVRVDGKREVLAKLVDFHRGDASAMVLRDLQASGVLQTVERVPEGFIPPDGQRPKLMQVSTMGCNERTGGTTLAVLEANRVDLPQQIDNALESNGVFLDTVDGVDVRVSTSGGKLFILLSGDARSMSTEPI